VADRTLTKALDRSAGTADTVAASPGADARRQAPADTFSGLAGDHYELGDEVARGGMGRVIRAFDRRLGRVVAVKLLVDDTPSRRERFAREAQITARLQHPGIVPIYEAGTLDSGDLAYAMKLVSGRELQVAIDETDKLADRLPLVPRIIEVVEAIAYAHREGVMHRDLKPSNIILGEFGETVVIDWGIAKELDAPVADVADEPAPPTSTELTRPGSVVGTPAYMAPEQAAGEDVDDRADVYALGAILYHVLAGRRPYDGRDGTAVIAQVVVGPPPALDTIEPHVPAALAAIVRRAMDRDPAGRYSARELADELRRFTTGQLVASHRYTLGERIARWIRRHRAAVAVGTIAFVMLAGGAIAGTWRIVQERDRAEEARVLEAARADDLLVARAATLATTNPTGAVGLLHQLPATATNWRAASDVLASAKLHGVPRAFPASHETSGLAISRDGTVAYSAGNDGVVRRLDLVGGDAAIIDHGSGRTMLELAGDERSLVIVDTTAALRFYDLATGAVSTVAVSSPVERVVTAGSRVVWTDKTQAVWFLARGDTTPRRIAFDAKKIDGMSISPDGNHLVVAADPDTAVFDLRGDEPAMVLRRAGGTGSLSWSADGSHLAVATFTGLDDIDMTGPVPATRTIRKGMTMSAVYVGDDIYFSDAQLLFRSGGEGMIVEIANQPATYAAAVATRDRAVFVTLTGTIGVVGRGGSATIRAPVSRLWRATASADATRFLVATEDHVLCYDAADVVPATLETLGPGGGFEGFAGSDRYLATQITDDWRLFDLATGKPTSLGAPGFATFASSAPDASYTLARLDKQRLVIVRPGHPAEQLGTKLVGMTVSAEQFELISETEVIDVTARDLARHPAWKSTEPIRSAVTASSHVAVATEHVVWRRLASGATDTISVPRSITTMVLAGDGTLYVASETTIYRCDVGGSLVEHAKLDKPAAALWFYDRVGVVAMDETGTLWTIAGPNAVPVRAMAEGLSTIRLAAHAPMVVGFSHFNELEIFDLETRLSWALGDGLGNVGISPDGRHVATPRNERTAIISIDLAADRAAYERQLEATTNLRIGDTPNQIIWP
jgi:predicted Ser/Thr protein kinase